VPRITLGLQLHNNSLGQRFSNTNRNQGQFETLGGLEILVEVLVGSSATFMSSLQAAMPQQQRSVAL